MRQVDIRAWNKYHKKMYDVYGFNLNVGMFYCESETGKTHTFGSLDLVLMQFTGLHDKNGKKIYEGDIVKWDDCSDGRYWRVAIVEINPDIRFRCFDCPLIDNSSAHGKVFKFGSFIYTDTHNHLYVIGNIHQNPELLES